MKIFLRIFSVFFFLILASACAKGNEYNDLIDEAIEFHQNDHFRGEEDSRDNADVTVWDNGRYIRIAFIDQEGNKVRERFFEKVGGNFEELKQYEGESLMSKKPDYQEQMGEEL
ncbi:hypothetical protein [Shouchella clausii]|uniref:hypothetical protein n=1 Tax=Shouchella clausii TaxID=79880 RepID=UPI0007915AC5|nr:hypothetical protein [Shouchella clausii]KKI85319.1 hypothetical protein WZ76_15760 [Shouchella clausii]